MKGRGRPRLGGQLNRSETVTVRLDPKLNYLCELAARSQRRTKSSMVEAAVFESLASVPIDVHAQPENRQSIASLAEQLWDVSESERFRRLAILAPHLMTYEEQKIWSVLTKNPYFWTGHWQRLGTEEAVFIPEPRAENLLYFRVEQNWELIKAVAVGRKAANDLPQARIVERWGYGLPDAQLIEGLPRIVSPPLHE